MKRKSLYWGLPLVGVLFCLWYVKQATSDVIYSDYVRLVNFYLPDVWNPDKFFVPDLLTRIPVNYLGRIINISLFDFSLTFDRVAGVLGLGLSALVLGSYCMRRCVGKVWFVILMILMFSLNKWEMITNGSGWSHFLAFAGFYYHYLVFDRVWAGEELVHDRVKLMVLPFVITLFLAGPYCAIYSVTVILAYGFGIASSFYKTKKVDQRYIIYSICVMIPLLLYMLSNSFAVEDHAGAVSEPLLSAVISKPSFFLRFFLKSFASMVMGEEVMRELITSDGMVLALGAVVLFSYLLALWMNYRFRLYEKTILPLMLLAAGGLNHVLILLSRWIFLKENYGMSSRYALQFQIGIFGILLTIALVWKQLKRGHYLWTRVMAALICVVLMSGNIWTTYQEVKKAPYREESFERIAAIALNFEQESDESLQEVFEYRKNEEGSGAKIRAALTILKNQGWNIYSVK